MLYTYTFNDLIAIFVVKSLMMQRKALGFLNKWKDNQSKKPLIIQGARQVGKTWLMQEFGKSKYNRVAYFNFETTRELHGLFTQGIQINNIMVGLSILAGFQINEEYSTLIIFDEVQACPQAITSLKYFNEQKPSLSIMAAGSLLGVAMHKAVSFPVGKVEFLNLYPLDFHEFLDAMGQAELLSVLQSENRELIRVFHNPLIELLKQYFCIGGMPEVVYEFVQNKDFKQARRLQNNILLAYENDFSKHAPVEQLPRIRLVWQSVIGQLAKENSKFVYNVLRSGARAKDFDMAINWLKDAGLIQKVTRITKSAWPITSYANWSDFKIYMNDVGLLGAKGDLSSEIILKGNDLFMEFKGTLTEQFVLQQLIAAGVQAYYWKPENALSEVDFVIQLENDIIPIEVKAGKNVRSRSLHVYHEKYKPKLCVRTSLMEYQDQDWMKNIPLYGFLAWVESMK